MPKTEGTSLEVALGSGVYLPTLADISRKVFASDIETAHLEDLTGIKQEFFNIIVMQDDIKSSALMLNSFDLILCSEVIEHIEEHRMCLIVFTVLSGLYTKKVF